MKTPLLLVCAALATASFAQVPGYIPATGLVAWYPMDNSPADAGPNGLSGTAYSSTSATDRFGATGGATGFSGYAYDMIPSNALFNTGVGMTVSAWVNLVDASANQKVMGRVNGSFNSGFILGVQNNQLNPEVWNSDGTAHSFTSGSITSGTWVQVAITWQSSGYLVSYVNGMAVDSISTEAASIGSNTEPLIIGGSPWSQSPLYFGVNGSIDDIGIWSRALSASEMQAVYAGSSTEVAHLAGTVSESVFPIPATTQAFIRSSPTDAGEPFVVLDAMGRTVAQGKLAADVTTLALDGWAPGVYTVRIGDRQHQALRLIKR